MLFVSSTLVFLQKSMTKEVDLAVQDMTFAHALTPCSPLCTRSLYFKCACSFCACARSWVGICSACLGERMQCLCVKLLHVYVWEFVFSCCERACSSCSCACSSLAPRCALVVCACVEIVFVVRSYCVRLCSPRAFACG